MESRRCWHALAVAATVVCAGAVQAQQATGDLSCPRTRAEVRDECIAFMKTHEWSEPAGDWVLKGGGKAVAKVPEGVTSRATIRAERDAFMKANRWNEATAQWEPRAGKPPARSELSRAEVKRQTDAFMRTHRWDESSGAYVSKGG